METTRLPQTGEDYRLRLSELAELRGHFEIRAHVLPADLALVGLLDDLLDASTAAIERIDRSVRVAYPLVRTAFEAAQRIVALATDDDYVGVGTRAWLYYQHKDASVRRRTEAEKADKWLEAVVLRMLEIWRPHNGNAEELIAREDARLRQNRKMKRRPPDNFMERDFADLLQERYSKILPNGIPGAVKQLNQGIYSALSRDSHAREQSPQRWRFSPTGRSESSPAVSMRLRDVAPCCTVWNLH